MPFARLFLLAGVVLLVGASAIPAAAQAPDALVGRWHVTRVVDPDGGRPPGPEEPTHITFTEKGTMHVEQAGDPSRQIRATYRVRGDTIIIDVKQRSGVERVRFALQNDRLKLFDEAQAVVFQRIPN